MNETSAGKKRKKDQLKIQIDHEIHKVLRRLCEKTRRTPAGQVEFMTIMFDKHDLDNLQPPEWLKLQRRSSG